MFLDANAYMRSYATRELDNLGGDTKVAEREKCTASSYRRVIQKQVVLMLDFLDATDQIDGKKRSAEILRLRNDIPGLFDRLEMCMEALLRTLNTQTSFEMCDMGHHQEIQSLVNLDAWINMYKQNPYMRYELAYKSLLWRNNGSIDSLRDVFIVLVAAQSVCHYFDDRGGQKVAEEILWNGVDFDRLAMAAGSLPDDLLRWIIARDLIRHYDRGSLEGSLTNYLWDRLVVMEHDQADHFLDLIKEKCRKMEINSMTLVDPGWKDGVETTFDLAMEMPTHVIGRHTQKADVVLLMQHFPGLTLERGPIRVSSN
jgi:hypothetical protein